MDEHRKSRASGWPRISTIPVVVLLLIAACSTAIWSARAETDPPSVAWPEAGPESEGFDADALDRLAADLAGRNTKALFVARHGRLVYEWYAPDFGPNHRHYTAAMAKGTAAIPALLAAANNGYLSLADPVAAWVPSWAEDPARAQVLVRDLAAHRSGLEDIDFDAGAAASLDGWRQSYYDHPGERFRLALDSAEFRFAPATGFGYSGVGYYVLSYVMARALQSESSSARDVLSLLAESVYDPLGIPPEAWSIGYARRDTVDGVAMTHLGSGGELTARAAARIGQLFAQDGCFEGRRLLDGYLVRLALGEAGTPPAGEEEGAEAPVSALGWWRGGNGAWPSLPVSAVAAIGAGHQVVAIDPARDLVAVRLGGDLSGGNEPFHAALDRYLWEPLYDALVPAQPSRPHDADDLKNDRAGTCRSEER
ncbi:MAG: serine hydrolase domain-containing protein [Gemmatimonadota bacterium]